jgi:hypothetical protein
VKLVKALPEIQEDGTMEEGQTDILVKVENFEEGYFYQWKDGKFNDRVFMMRDLVNEYFDSGNLPKLSNQDDPFWDPPEPMLIGQSYMSLKSLGYLIDNQMESKILSSEGSSGVRGVLSVKYVPTGPSGDGEPDEDDLPEEPEDLVGKQVTFRIEIDKAADLPADLCKNTFVNYKLFFETSSKYHQTPECEGKNRNPVYSYQKVHQIDQVTPSMLSYLKNGQVTLPSHAHLYCIALLQGVRVPGLRAGKEEPEKGDRGVQKGCSQKGRSQTQKHHQTRGTGKERGEKAGHKEGRKENYWRDEGGRGSQEVRMLRYFLITLT